MTVLLILLLLVVLLFCIIIIVCIINFFHWGPFWAQEKHSDPIEIPRSTGSRWNAADLVCDVLDGLLLHEP